MENENNTVSYPCGCGTYSVNLAGKTKDVVLPCPVCRRLAVFRIATGAAEQLSWYAVDEMPQSACEIRNIDRVGPEQRAPVIGGGLLQKAYVLLNGKKIYTHHGKKILLGVAYRIHGNRCMAHEKNGAIAGYSTTEELMRDLCSCDVPELTLPF